MRAFNKLFRGETSNGKNHLNFKQYRLAQVRLRIGIGPASKMSKIWEKSEEAKVNANKWPADGIKTSIYYIQNWLKNDEQIILGTSSNWFVLLQKCVENYPNRKINGETFSDNLNFYIFFYEKLSKFCSKLVGNTDKAELRKLWAKYDSFLGAALEEFHRAQNIVANSGIEQAKVKMCH
uniref:Uncharacterized protein n=1 Tax=Globodera rostochiensis TaxID=31243 RepID=A0A914H3N6_GLORO